MAWTPKPKPLAEQIAEANATLKAARYDGNCQHITNAARKLDELLDQLPRQASS